MKRIALIALSAIILFAAPSCKKQQCKLVKHVVSEEYVYADPCGDNVDINVNLKADKAKKEAEKLINQAKRQSSDFLLELEKMKKEIRRLSDLYK